MSEQNTVVVVEETKVKRSRIKGSKTGAEIVAELNKLQEEVGELETALATVDPENLIYKLAEKELNSKRKELEDSLDTVYKF